MNIYERDFLRLVENAGTLAFFDIEATGLRADYNSALVVSIKPYKSKPFTLTVEQPGNDRKLVREAKEALEQFDCICGYYSKGFDTPFLNTRLLRWGMPPIQKKPHIDLYFTLKASLLTARKGQGHLLRFLETPEEKMDMSPESWNRILADFKEEIKVMQRRCETDVEGLQALYERAKIFIRDIKRS